MPRELGGSKSPEGETATALTRHAELTLPQDIHSKQRVELKSVSKLDTDDLVKHKRKAWFGKPRFVRDEANPERVSFHLSFALSGS